MSPRYLSWVTGFSLIELMLTTVTLGFVASIAAINMAKDMPRKHLDSAATHLTWSLRALRLRAISQHHNITVTFLNNHTYSVWIDRNDNNVTDPGETQITDLSVTYPGVTIVATANPLLTTSGTVSNVPTITLSNGMASKSLTMSVIGDIIID